MSLLAFLGQGAVSECRPLARTLGILEKTVVFGLSALPDGRVLVHATNPGVPFAVMLWDLNTGERSELAIAVPGPFGVSATSGDGRWLALNLRPAEEVGEIGLWNIKTGELIRSIERRSLIVQMMFSPDGSVLALLPLHSREIALFDTVTGQLRHTPRAPQYLEWILFSPDGEAIAAGSVDRTIRLWNVGTGKETSTLVSPVPAEFPAAFSPDGRTLAVCAPACQVKLWDVTLGKGVQTLTGHTARIFSAVFSPDGRILATGSSDGTIRLWDVPTGGELCVIDLRTVVREEEYHGWVVSSAVFTPDGTLLISASMASRWEKGPAGVPTGKTIGMIHLWDVGHLTGR